MNPGGGVAFGEEFSQVLGAEADLIDLVGLGDLLILQILGNQFFIDDDAMLFVQLHHVGKVAPATGGDKGLAVYRGFDLVKVGFLDIQISKDCGVDDQFCKTSE